MPLRGIMLYSFFILCIWTGFFPRINSAQIDAGLVRIMKGYLLSDPCGYWGENQRKRECHQASVLFRQIPENLRGACKIVMNYTCNDGFFRQCKLEIAEGSKAVFKPLSWCINQAGIYEDPIRLCPPFCSNASKKKKRKQRDSKKHESRNPSNMLGSGGTLGAGGIGRQTQREDRGPEDRENVVEETYRGQDQNRNNNFRERIQNRENVGEETDRGRDQNRERIQNSENVGEETYRGQDENKTNSFREKIQDRENVGEETNRGQLDSRNSSFSEGIQERVKSLLECAYCSEVQRPPYKRCPSQHLICNNCSHWWPRGECPLCKKPVTRQQDDTLLTEMVRLILPPTNSPPEPSPINGGSSPHRSSKQSDDNVVSSQVTNTQQENSVPEETQPATPELRLVPIDGSQQITTEQSRPSSPSPSSLRNPESP